MTAVFQVLPKTRMRSRRKQKKVILVRSHADSVDFPNVRSIDEEDGEDERMREPNPLAAYFMDIRKFPVQKRPREIEWFTELDTLYRNIIASIRVSRRARILVKNRMGILSDSDSGPDEGRDTGDTWWRFWWRERNWKKIDMLIRILQQAVATIQPDQDIDELADVSKTLACIDPYLERAVRLRQEVVEHNVRLVVNFAKRYTGSPFEFSDIIQEGNIGLLHAVDKFFVKKGWKFSTYAIWWVHSRIRRYANTHGGAIVIPAHVGDRLVKLRSVEESFREEHQQSPTDQELAHALGCSVEHIRNLVFVRGGEVSLSQPISSEDKRPLVIPRVTKRSDLPEESLADQNRKKIIQKLLVGLSPREQIIIDLRYGLTDGVSHTLEEIGKLFPHYGYVRVSRERVRQLETQALHRIRKNPKTRELFIEFKTS